MVGVSLLGSWHELSTPPGLPLQRGGMLFKLKADSYLKFPAFRNCSCNSAYVFVTGN